MAKKSNVDIKAIHVIRVIVFLLIGVICYLSYSNVVDFLTKSRIFAVKDVVVDASIQFINMDQLRQLKGRNIFLVDINGIEGRIKAQYPQISQLRVIRELPDRIKVLAKNREAVCQVPWKGKFLLVDAEGVAMYETSNVPGIPLVTGAFSVKSRVVLGSPLASKPLNLALRMIQALKSRPHSSRLKVTSIDVTNLSKINIALGETMHLVLDQDTFMSKLGTLEMLITEKKIDFLKVKYIDLRFNEPVMGEN